MERLKTRPLLGPLFGEKLGVTPGAELTEAQKRLAEEYRRGLAEALGVKPEAIRQEPIERWIRSFTRAFVKPEYYADAIVTLTGTEAERLGNELGLILKEAMKYE